MIKRPFPAARFHQFWAKEQQIDLEWSNLNTKRKEYYKVIKPGSLTKWTGENIS